MLEDTDERDELDMVETRASVLVATGEVEMVKQTRESNAVFMYLRQDFVSSKDER